MPRKEFLVKLTQYPTGKTIEDIAKECKLNQKQLADLKLNENLYWPSPYRPSPKVKKAIIKNIDKINIYSSNLSELSRAISKYVKIPAENIIIGAGIDGILDTLARILINKNDETIISVPTYEMYEFITKINDGIPRFIQRDKNFDIPIDKLLSSINKKTKIIFLCSPNHPTGNIIEYKQLEVILKKVKTFIIIDEAFVEFAENSLIPLTKKYKNLIILRTFSKAFSLAAFRLGYGIASKGIVKDFNKVRLPFSINNLGTKAAIAALEDQKYLKTVVEKIKEGREYLLKNIKFKTCPSEANFVLVNVSPLAAREVFYKLLRQGVLVRDCGSFESLKRNFIRIKVGRPEQNKKIVKAINSIYENLSRN